MGPKRGRATAHLCAGVFRNGGEFHSTGPFTAALLLAGQGTYLFRSGTSGTSGFNGKNGKRSGTGCVEKWTDIMLQALDKQGFAQK